MEIQNFEGIRSYHDGSIVSEWCNMIPMGKSAVDRLGDHAYTWSHLDHKQPRGFIVDKYNRLFFVNDSDLYWTAGRLDEHMANDILYWENVFSKNKEQLSFVESTFDDIIFICDHENLYALITSRLNAVVDLLTVKLPHNPNAWDDDDDYEMTLCIPSYITWFDGRLVMLDKKNNIMWLSKYWPSHNPIDTDITIDENLNPEDEEELWKDYYLPVNAANIYNTVIQHNGQLYALGNRCIEIWSRTGTDESPIQTNSTSVINIGCINAKLLNNILYFIGVDHSGQQAVYNIDNQNQLKRISNPEIERRFGKRFGDIVVITQREESFICIYKEVDNTADRYREGYCVGESGRWWKWDNTIQPETFYLHPTTLAPRNRPYRSIWGPLLQYHTGGLGVFREDSRLTEWDDPSYATRFFQFQLPRFIREHIQLPINRRSIINDFKIDCDTGAFFGTGPDDENPDMNNSVYLRCSFDRGHSFGPVFWRRLGKAGQNQRGVSFRRVGSGLDLCYEIGTSGNARFQIFGIEIEII